MPLMRSNNSFLPFYPRARSVCFRCIKEKLVGCTLGKDILVIVRSAKKKIYPSILCTTCPENLEENCLVSISWFCKQYKISFVSKTVRKEDWRKIYATFTFFLKNTLFLFPFLPHLRKRVCRVRKCDNRLHLLLCHMLLARVRKKNP